MTTTTLRRTFAALLLLFALGSCKTTDPLPKPPAGTYVFGNSQNQAGYDIMEMNDGGFLLLGGSQEEEAGDYDIYMIKTDSQGEKMWERRLRKDNTDEFGMYIRETSDGYAVLAFRSGGNGSYNGNFVLVVLDDAFNKQWERVIPGSGYTGGTQNIGNGFFVLDNGNYLVSGNLGYQQSYLILDENGSVISENAWFPNSGTYWTTVPDVVRLNDGGYMFAGPGQGFNYETELFVKFLDADGNDEFSTTIPNLGNGFEVSVIGQRPDSSLYFFLQDVYTNGEVKMLSIPGKADFTTTEYEVSSNLYLRSGITLPSGNSLLVGGSNPNYGRTELSDFILREVSPSGDLILSKTWGGDNSDLARKIIRSSDNRNVMFGQTQSYGAGGTDFCLIID